MAFLPDRRLALCTIEPVPPDRSGLWRAYPFAPATQALDKLRFVHDVIQSPRTDGVHAPAQSSCQTGAAQAAAPATTPA